MLTGQNLKLISKSATSLSRKGQLDLTKIPNKGIQQKNEVMREEEEKDVMELRGFLPLIWFRMILSMGEKKTKQRQEISCEDIVKQDSSKLARR